MIQTHAPSLPEGFDFYHLGQVERGPISRGTGESWVASENADQVGAAFRIQGDWQGLLILLFDAGLDASTYCEMGNVIASRFADHLSLTQEQDVLISPPLLMNFQEIQARLVGRRPEIEAEYFHHTAGATLKLKALVYAESPLDSQKEHHDV